MNPRLAVGLKQCWFPTRFADGTSKDGGWTKCFLVGSCQNAIQSSSQSDSNDQIRLR